MHYIAHHSPLQRTVGGDMLFIAAHEIVGSRPGQSVYLQAGVHGPEIIGSALLIELLRFVRTQEDIAGKITIVPLANPVGVRAQEYGFQYGRWNTQNGKDWNRIFSKSWPAMKNNPSIEEKIAATLQGFARGHDVVLDIHASGKRSTPHLYTNVEGAAYFAALAPNFSILVEDDDYIGAFDESCGFAARENGGHIFFATWEAGTHGTIERAELQRRLANLICFLRFVGVLSGSPEQIAPGAPAIPLKRIHTLCAPGSGYVVWEREPGAHVRAGEAYAKLYDSQTGKIAILNATQSFYLISQYPLQAVAEGQELAKIAVQ